MTTAAVTITGRTKIVGVWGHPVVHSRSPVMHNAALAALGLDWAYVPFDVDPADVEAALGGLRALGLAGVNVTVPLKEALPPLLDEVSEEAARVGSVNTVVSRDGRLHGHSTDGAGFLRALEDAGQGAEGRQALILGAGGSARAVAFALAARGTHCRISNRTKARAMALARDIGRRFPGRASMVEWGMKAGQPDLVINTTTLGMHPQEDDAPALPPGVFGAGPFVCDLIYAPAQTRFLREAAAAGCGTMNGVKMLVYQGALSLSLWTGLPLAAIPTDVMEAAVLGSL